MIEVQDLSMDYGSVKAVSDCTFTVRKGEIVGLVGPNGAGKSTIMKILSTQIVPTSGKATVNGYDIYEQPLEVRKSLGFLPEQAPLYDDMEVREYIEFAAKSRGLEKKALLERLEWTCHACTLEDVWCRPISELSKGYRQRVGIAQALIHDPPVLILDEPTSGLDPLQIMEIRNLVKELSKDKAILFSSHILQEIAAVTDRAVVINGGKITADGRLDELSQKVFPEAKIRVKFEPDVPLDKLESELAETGARIVKDEQGSFLIYSEKPEKVKDLIATFALNNGVKILELSLERPDLEDVFSALLHMEHPNS